MMKKCCKYIAQYDNPSCAYVSLKREFTSYHKEPPTDKSHINIIYQVSFPRIITQTWMPVRDSEFGSPI